MKPRLLLCLALVLSSVAAYGLGPTSVYEVNRTNLNTTCPFLLIKTEQGIAPNEDMILFRVAVMMPNGNYHPADFRGFLTIKNGGKHIAVVETCKTPHDPARYFPEMPKKFRDGSVEYDFTISPQYLSDSDFMICDGNANSCYRFTLKDFVNEK